MSKSRLLTKLAEHVRMQRKGRGLTLKQLAQKSKLSERFLSSVEAGMGNISVVKLDALARALGTHASELLRENVSAPPKVVALLGLRGAGKSAVGAELAKLLKVEFVELDRLVEQKTGMALGEVFAMHGEGFYRQQEVSALVEFLAAHKIAVLATGGGIVESENTFQILRRNAFTAWLKAPPEEHWARVVRQGDLRPMKNRPQAMQELKRRWLARQPLYAKAELVVDTEGKSATTVAKDIALQLRTRLGKAIQ